MASQQNEKCPMKLRRHDKGITDLEEMHGIMKKAKVCRLGLYDEENRLPYVVPMSFGFEQKEMELFFHSAKEGRKIDIIRKKPVICVEVEDLLEIPIFDPETLCNSTQRYRSVMMYGKIDIVVEPKERFAALKSIVKHQSGTALKECTFDAKKFAQVLIMKFKIEQWSAKMSPV